MVVEVVQMGSIRGEEMQTYSNLYLSLPCGIVLRILLNLHRGALPSSYPVGPSLPPHPLTPLSLECSNMALLIGLVV